jgi:serine/threonine protein kinase
LPPDFDPEVIPHNGERADRDLYALGLTLYEALTARYPWDTSEPPINQPAPDPRELSGFADLAPDLVTVVLKAIAPRRAERFGSAIEFRDALRQVRHASAPLSAWAMAAVSMWQHEPGWTGSTRTPTRSSHTC